MKMIGLLMLFLGAAGTALANLTIAVPEIDSTSSIGALTLLSGALLLIRSRRKK
jgi:LPXTG-motif cell wall-anchored protein